MKKNKWIKAGILLVVFSLALVISSLIINRDVKNQSVGMGEPTIPGITFQVQESPMNRLQGYTQDMEITAMRDTITPVPVDGKLKMNVEFGRQGISKISYIVFSLDGTQIYLEDSCEYAESVELNIGNVFDNGAELVLKVVLTVEDQDIFYYTRIKSIKDLGLNECLAFAKDFHNKTFDTANRTELFSYLELNEDSDNTTFQTVNIHSNEYHICWGDLKPEVTTEVEWSIKETNSSYTSLQAEYRVMCINENEVEETYNVKEFFRVRLSEGEMYLLDYNRTMNQVFEGDSEFLTNYSMVLGITEPDVDYTTNAKGTVVAFVQERELWIYNKKADQIIQAFSFADVGSEDIRSRNDEHELKIISMDEDGNTMFTVSGYMNCGSHEGRVGVGVYYYDISDNSVNEKAFIPSTRSAAIANEELGKMIYCNQDQQLLYVLIDGTLYQVNLESEEQTILKEGLEEGQYVVSGDGHWLAYQTNGDQFTATEVHVMNLADGQSYIVQADSGESIQPLGFVTDDFICGYRKAEDMGKTLTGTEVYPMYKMEIMESADNVVKTYEQQDIYISDVWVEENLITLNRMTRVVDIYTGTSRDYITNTEEKRDLSVTLDIYTTDLKEAQARLIFEKKIDDLSPKVLKANLQTSHSIKVDSFEKQAETDLYYVYGLGEMSGIYDNAAQAIQRAEEISGVVVSDKQDYIWEKGNRDLGYYIECDPFKVTEGQTSLDACLKYMEKYNADQMDLSGCSMSQVMYIINRGIPVITMIDPNHAVLLVGYNWINMYYIDPVTGEEMTMTQDALSETIEKAGNTFIGYK